MTLKRCAKCVLPETHETIVFDTEGVCNICRQQEAKETAIDWRQRKLTLDGLINEHRDRYAYDCIIPFSGGKDSTWTLFYLIKEYNVRPLVVTFDHGFLRPGVIENTRRTMRRLGVAHHVFTPNWKVVQKLMLQSFLEKGDFCWHCHTGIFAYPMWVALQQEVPLVIWGEPSSEYTAYYSYENDEEVDERRFNRFVNLGINGEDMLFRIGDSVDERDMRPFTYPPLRDLRRLKYRSVCLGSFIPWDVKRQAAIISTELGWQGDEVENVPPGYSYEKIECHLQGVRDYIKYLKRGYTRPTHLASIDIRHGRMDRDTALQMIEEYEGRRPASLDLFLEYVGLTEEEFLDITRSHHVSPWDGSERVPIEIGPKPHDFASWSRDGAMPRADTEAQLGRRRRTERPNPASA